MFEHIDNYCERLDAGFWSEPLNALTNLAFLLAAWLLWRHARKHGRLTLATGLLTGLIALIGIGSGLFHTFATGWAEVADVVPILLFQLAYLYFYSKHIIGMRSPFAVLTVTLYFLSTLPLRHYMHLMNGSVMYAPTFAVLLGLALYHYLAKKEARSTLLIATAVFSVSITCRTLDMALCPYFPTGIHFVWHLLNALTLSLLMLGYMANIHKRPFNSVNTIESPSSSGS
jgi:hypothetical protein